MFTAASIGIALSTTGYDQPEDLLRDADVTMYRAKKLSKTAHYEVFDRTTPTKVGPLQLESDLRRALERQELCLHYQPIVDLSSGNVTGFETLVRLKHPERGLISPTEFIPMAEETGLIVPIGWWVLWEACRQVRVWQVQFPKIPPLKVNVNFSSQQFSQSDLITQIDHVLQETGLKPSNLGLEITESAIMENAEGATLRLKQLREMGVKLLLDNFGTGYSSLSYLHRFAFNSLKIDHSFISKMGINGKNLEIVRSILTLAHTLEMNVIAEGVETATQLVQLTALKCEHGQGNLFSQPLECEAIGDLIALEQQLYGDLKLASTCSALQKYAMK